MEKYYDVIEKIYDLSTYTTLIPAVIGVLRWRFFEFSLKLAAIHALRAAVFSHAGLIFSHFQYGTRPLYYISTCLDLGLMCLLGAYILAEKRYSLALLGLVLIFWLTMLCNYFVEDSKQLMSSNLMSIETIFVIFIIIISLRKVSSTIAFSSYKSAMIWILSALLFGNLLALLLSFFTKSVNEYSNYFFLFCWYLISPAVIILMNGMLSRGFLMVRKPLSEKKGTTGLGSWSYLGLR